MSRVSTFVVLVLMVLGLDAVPDRLSGQSIRVIPDGQTELVLIGSTNTLNYGVEYIAPAGSDTIDVVLTCLGNFGGCGAISPSSLRLGPNEMANVYVEFTAPATKGSGDVMLEAVGDAMETLSDIGTIHIDARPPYDVEVIHLTNGLTHEAGATGITHSFQVVNTGLSSNTYGYSGCQSTNGVAAGCTVSATSSGTLAVDASHTVSMTFDVPSTSTGNGYIGIDITGTGISTRMPRDTFTIDPGPGTQDYVQVSHDLLTYPLVQGSVGHTAMFRVMRGPDAPLGNAVDIDLSALPDGPLTNVTIGTTGTAYWNTQIPANESEIEVPVHFDILATPGSPVAQLDVDAVPTQWGDLGMDRDSYVMQLVRYGIEVTAGQSASPLEVEIQGTASFVLLNTGDAATFALDCAFALGSCSDVPTTVSLDVGQLLEQVVHVTGTSTGTADLTLTASIVFTGGTTGGSASIPHLVNPAPPAPGVTVTPVGAGGPVAPLTPLTQEFDVTWTGLSQASFDLVPTCTSDPGCSAEPVGPISLQNSTQRVTVSFNAGSSAGVATVKLKATKSGEPAVKDSASVDWTVTNDLQLTVEDANPGLEELRGECLSVAAGSGSIECDDYRVTYPLLPITRMNRVRNTALLYNSATATPRKILGANFRAPTGKLIDSLMVQLFVDGSRSDSIMHFEVPESGEPIRVAGEWADPLLSGTQLVHYEMRVEAFYPGPPVTSDEISAEGTFIMVDHREEFGRGWWPAGYERLNILQNQDTLLWVGGDGSSRAYVQTSPDTFVAWTRGVPDVITVGSPSASAMARDTAHYLDITTNTQAAVNVGPPGNHSGLDSGDALTVAFWVNPAPNYGRVVGLNNQFPNRSWWVDARDTTISFGAQNGPNGGAAWAATGNVMTGGAWNFVVIQYDGSQPVNTDRVRVFTNGIERSLTFTGVDFPDSLTAASGSTFGVGKITANTNGKAMKLGELAVVRSLLSAQELSSWRINGIDFGHAALAAGYEWRQSLADVSPLGNNLKPVELEATDYVITGGYPSRVAPPDGWTGDGILDSAGYLDLVSPRRAVIPAGMYTALGAGTQRTWAFWINPSVYKGRFAGIWNDAGSQSWYLHIKSTGVLGVCLKNVAANGNGCATTPNALPLNQWTFAVIAFDGSGVNDAERMRIWLNAQPQALVWVGKPIPDMMVNAPQEFGIGRATSSVTGMEGYLGEFAILNEAIDSATVANWYSSGIDFSVPALAAGYRWQGDILDAGVYGNDLNWENIDTTHVKTTTDYAFRPTNGGQSSGSAYVRHVLGGGEVHYDAAGRHLKTVDRNGNETLFGHTVLGTETRLTSIELPTPSGPAPAYRFHHSLHGSDVVLDSIGVIGGDGNWLEYSVATSASAAGGFLIDTITTPIDTRTTPDGIQTAFSYEPGGEGLLSTVTDVRGAETHVSYVTQKVSEIAILTPGDNTIADITMPYLAASIVGTDPTPSSVAGLTEVDSVSAVFDGPRSDVADTTRFFLNGWGAVRGIRDAKGYNTLIKRTNESFKALVTDVTYPNARVVEAHYRSSGLLEYVADHLDNIGYTYYEWDETLRKVTKVTSPDGVATSFKYDSLGNRVGQKVANDSLIFAYDPNGRGLLVAVTDAEGRTSSLAYDPTYGNLELETSALGHTVGWERDAVGRAQRITTDMDSVSANLYQRIDSITYDVMGRELTRKSRTTEPGDSSWALVTNAYDSVTGDRTSTQPTANGLISGNGGQSWGYDDLGRAVWQKSASSVTVGFQYDNSGNVVREYDWPDTSAARYTAGYDALNRLDWRATRDKSYTATSLDGTAFPYMGGALTIAGDSATFDYDAMGNLIEADNRYAQVTRDHELDGLLKSETMKLRPYSGCSPSSCSGSYSDTYTTGYVYNRDRQRTRVDHPFNSWSTTYAYDPTTGRLSSITDPNAKQYSFTYNGNGQVETKAFMMGADTVAYDADGRIRTHRMSSNGTPRISETIDRNLAGLVTYEAGGETMDYTGLGHLRYLRSGFSLEREEFLFPNGLGESMRDSTWVENGLDTPTNTKHSIAYFGGAVATKTDEWGPPEYGYPIPTGWRGNHYSREFDAAGNQTVATSVSPHWNLGVNPGVKTGEGRDLSRSYYGSDNRLMVFQAARHEYNELSQPQDSTGVYEEYWYDALGRRILKQSSRPAALCNAEHTDICGYYGSFTDRTIWDGDQILWELRGNDPASQPSGNHTGRVAYVHAGGVDAPVGIVRNGTSVALHTNWRGLYAMGTDASGNLVGTVDVAWPAGNWGARFGHDPDTDQHWYGSLVTGGQDASGLLYRRNRYYDPESGQFTQEDPIGIAGGLNLYGYANGDPINFSDPFGLCTSMPSCYLIARLRGAADAAIAIGKNVLENTVGRVRAHARGTMGVNSLTGSISGTGDARASTDVNLNLAGSEMTISGGLSVDLFSAPEGALEAELELATPGLQLGGLSFGLAANKSGKFSLTSIGVFVGAGWKSPLAPVDLNVEVLDEETIRNR